MCMCVCVCVYVCVYVEDQPYWDKHDVCTLYGTLYAGYMGMYLCAVKGGSTENQSYGNSTCTENCQRNITMCACA